MDRLFALSFLIQFVEFKFFKVEYVQLFVFVKRNVDQSVPEKVLKKLQPIATIRNGTQI